MRSQGGRFRPQVKCQDAVHSRPKARTEGVLTERVDDELVVYDQLSQMAHCLSAPAASVFELCDGRLSPPEIAESLSLGPAIVEQAVDELRGIGLLDDGPVLESEYSRREAAVRFAKVGAAAFSAPMIYSVLIASAAAAASACVATGSPESFCTATSGNKAADARCCSGTCYNGSNGKVCVAPTCSLAGIGCILGGGTCCSGKCVLVLCQV